MRNETNVEKSGRTSKQRQAASALFYACSVSLALLVLASGCNRPADAPIAPASPEASTLNATEPASGKSASTRMGPDTEEAVAGQAEPLDGGDKLDGRDGRDLLLGRFRPRPKLRVREHLLRKAKYAVVDVHVHPRIRKFEDRLPDLVRMMDQQNIAVCVSLDGRLGDLLQDHLDVLWKEHRDRFVVYANIDWRGNGQEDDPASWDCHRDDFASRTVKQLEHAKKLGVSGLKLFKQFGLGYRNPDGSLIKIDDPRWDPIWQACGKLGLVVIMHTADPAAFFDPIDETNERWEELHRHPEWSFHGPQWPSREELLEARNRVIARHKETTFIGAHMANNSEDLATVGEWLKAHPNLYVEIAARIAELGRQPYTAREFFMNYSDRILFGSDGPRVPERMWLHWRLLETRDEYFPYSEKPFPPQGLWRIYGLGLPDDVLRKVYYENASRLIPGVRERVEKYRSRTTAADSSDS